MIVQHAAPVVNAASSIVARWESYKLGRDLFAAREPMARCTNAECRRGWWDALNAAADAETHAYLKATVR